jgi:hypothetical protein
VTSNRLKQPVTDRALISNGLYELVTDRFNLCNGLYLTSITKDSCYVRLRRPLLEFISVTGVAEANPEVGRSLLSVTGAK